MDPAATSCPFCRSPLQPGSAKCPTCGTPLDAPAVPPTVVRTVLRSPSTGPTQVAPERGSADTAQVGIRPGRRFGHYEVVRPLARGGMGVVFVAHDTKLDRQVALKVLLAGDLAGPEEVARFRREATAAGRLRHPRIVPIYDVGEEEGWSYIAMELVEGTPLHVLLRERKLPIDDGVRIVLQVADGIAHAHKNGVIHRDLKPANVLVDADGNARLTDFGLAKVAKGADLTERGTTLGTPNYMPPEQARGHVEEVDERSDVYALGAILYDVLTGRPPFVAATSMDTLVQVIQDVPPPPRTINANVPPELESICMRALEKDKARRFPGARDFAEALDRFLDRDAASPVPKFVRVRKRRSSRRHVERWVGIGAAVVLCGMIVATQFPAAKAPAPAPAADGAVPGQWRLHLREPFEETWPAGWLTVGGWHKDGGEMVAVGEGSIRLAEPIPGCAALEVEFVVDAGSPATLHLAFDPEGARVVFSPGPPARLWTLGAPAGHDVVGFFAEAGSRHTLRVERTTDALLAWWDRLGEPAIRTALAPPTTPIAPRLTVDKGKARLRQMRVYAGSEARPR